MPIKFLVLGGGGYFGFCEGGGGECQFYLYGRRDFSGCAIIGVIILHLDVEKEKTKAK